MYYQLINPRNEDSLQKKKKKTSGALVRDDKVFHVMLA